LTICTALFLFVYVGAEASYAGWIGKIEFFFFFHIFLATYAIEYYHFPEYQAAYISSFFWMAITAGRLLAGKKFYFQVPNNQKIPLT
jgi:fucose permease